MEPGGLIGLLTRYHVTASSDPRENRLTAAFAAVLDASPRIGEHVMRVWFGDERLGRPHVRIQRPVGGNVGWVDLELSIQNPAHHILWIEAKLDARESGENQIQNYCARLAQLGGNAARRRVLLLVPAQRAHNFPNYPPLPAGEPGRDAVPHLVTWQHAYGLVEDALRKERRPQIRWLTREVLAYMTAEGLRPSDLKPRHFSALKNIDEARAALATVADIATKQLARENWELMDPQPNRSTSYWEQAHTPTRHLKGPDRPRFQWGIDRMEAFAGVYFTLDAGGAAINNADEDWRSQLLTTADPDGAQWQQYESGNLHWIGRSTPLQQLLTMPTNDQNGEQLATYVGSTFESIMGSRALARGGTGPRKSKP